MNSKTIQTRLILRLIMLTTCIIVYPTFLPSISHAQSLESVKQAMASLQAKTAKLGTPGIKGEETVAGKTVPALYFGAKKMNGDYAVVDEVKQEAGSTATLFVRSDGDFVRVATNLLKDDGSRAVGTVLDPQGKAMASIRTDKPYYGEAPILGKPYITGYEPIHDASGKVIGIYFVGFAKTQ